MDLRSVKGRMEGEGLTGMYKHTREEITATVCIYVHICVLGWLDQRGGEVQAWCDE